MPECARSTFVPTSFWAALFAPTLTFVAVFGCWVPAVLLNFPTDVLDQLDWGVLGGGLVISYLYFVYRRRRNGWSIAPSRVAAAHEMTWEATAPVPQLLLDAFGPLNNGTVRNLLSSTTGGELRIGTFERFSAPNDEGYVQDWGFLGMRLARSLPNILLLARGEGSGFGGGDAASAPVGSQRLRLEGDFDDAFALYCPKGYETDALYLLTPDLMALLIDDAGGLSVQLLDDAIVFYSPRAIDFRDAALIERLFRIVDEVGAKALRGSARYRDDRAAEAGTVAADGRRLRRRIPRWPTLVLWYCANALFGLAIAAIALVIRLGPDPWQWADRAQQPWPF
ncbi:MAG: hypothetical protein JWP19_1506 [Rhodoglobus sp.]|nr:hypothetical protein [Rhodoglobus sp.]